MRCMLSIKTTNTNTNTDTNAYAKETHTGIRSGIRNTFFLKKEPVLRKQ
jgi:hypothetical protein